MNLHEDVLSKDLLMLRSSVHELLPHRQIKYPVDFDDELKTRKRQIR